MVQPGEGANKEASASFSQSFRRFNPKKIQAVKQVLDLTRGMGRLGNIILTLTMTSEF